MPDQKVLSGLQGLLPPARYDSVWIGPFEQLVGAGYALLGAGQHRINERDLDLYYLRVQKKITALVKDRFTSGKASDEDAFDKWAAGFYFNSGIQRIVWASERLLLTLSTVDCPCGSRPTEKDVLGDRPHFPAVLAGALARLEHVQNDHGTDLRKTRNMRNHQVGKYKRSDPLDPKRILAMLRYDVNNRKHKVYGRSNLLDRQSAKKGDNKTWPSASADVQMDLACQAFEIVCEAYRELKDWNPRA